MNLLQQKIESLLFFKNEPVRFIWLAKQLKVTANDIVVALKEMLPAYQSRGIQLIIGEDAAALVVADIAKEEMLSLTKNEEEKELSKQALETLAIILYKRKVTKAELDYLRGVNSMFILRNLLMRGLIEKTTNEEDKRSPFYIVSHETLAFLGVQQLVDLPGYETVRKKLETIEGQFKEELSDENQVSKENDLDSENTNKEPNSSTTVDHDIV